MYESIFDSAKLREKVTEHRARALDSSNLATKEFHVAMARSHLLLSMNAAWIASTDTFLAAIEANERWPHPQLAAIAERGANEQSQSGLDQEGPNYEE